MRDPRTIIPDEDRVGLPGHRGFGRDADFLARLLPELKDCLSEEALRRGLRINDVLHDILAAHYWGPRPDVVVVEPAPELTPEVSCANIDTAAKEATPTTPKQRSKAVLRAISVIGRFTPGAPRALF